jgi:hypothetical protein
MKITVSVSDFRDAFRDCNRQDNFSYEGLGALYEWIEEYEDGSGAETELDVIGLCCDFTEYADLKEFQGDYSKEDYPDIDSISEMTIVIPVTDESFIIQAF